MRKAVRNWLKIFRMSHDPRLHDRVAPTAKREFPIVRYWLIVALTIVFSVTAIAQDDDSDSETNSLLCECLAMIDMTEDKRDACDELVETTPEDVLRDQAAACPRNPIGAGDVDVCYCLASRPTNPDVVAACAALVPPDITREEKLELAQSCDEDE